MNNSPAATARHQKNRGKKLLDGTLVSFTTVRHPPAGFPESPRQVGLIELENGEKVFGQLLVPDGATLIIGQRVKPRMRLSRINEQGLRIYDVAYEVLAMKPVDLKKEDVFPGYILALTGPSGVGKSTVSSLLTSVVGEVTARVPIVTTREAKAGDEGEYHYLSEKEFRMLKRTGEIVSSTMIPSQTEKRLYGYRRTDIEAIWKEGKIPVVVTEMGLLQGLATHYGRRSILSCGLLPPGKSKRTMLSHLLHRLRTRGRDSEESIRDRMLNAERDLAFFEERNDLFDHLLVNEDLDDVLALLKGHVLELARV